MSVSAIFYDYLINPTVLTATSASAGAIDDAGAAAWDFDSVDFLGANKGNRPTLTAQKVFPDFVFGLAHALGFHDC